MKPKKLYLMSDKIPLDRYAGIEPMGLYQRSHSMMMTKTGSHLVDYTHDEDGEPFKGPLICDLDDEENTGVFPVFFMSPALIGTKEFYKDLLEAGVDNIEVHPVIIRDVINKKTIDDYLLLNILGRVSCVDMELSGCEKLSNDVADTSPNDAMSFINDLVIYSGKATDLDCFLLHEDTNCIFVSERVVNHLKNKGYDDIFFEEAAMTFSETSNKGVGTGRRVAKND